MKKYFPVLRSVPLFSGITADELSAMLHCLGAETTAAIKGEALLMAGDTPRHIGVVLAGQLHIVKDDADGNRTLMAALMPGDIFAEALCCAKLPESPVSVIAVTPAEVLLLPFHRILRTCPKACSFHGQLIANMMELLAQKNLMLQRRMDIIRIRSVREKVMNYLQSLPHKGKGDITVPFNREEMADFLCVERSALSHELSRMKADGLIDYRKNRFQLL